MMMPVVEMLMDIATEELSHLEIIKIPGSTRTALSELAEGTESEAELYRSLTQRMVMTAISHSLLYGGGPALTTGGAKRTAAILRTIGESRRSATNASRQKARAKIDERPRLA